MLSSLGSSTYKLESYPVRSPKVRFPHDEVHIILILDNFTIDGALTGVFENCNDETSSKLYSACIYYLTLQQLQTCKHDNALKSMGSYICGITFGS